MIVLLISPYNLISYRLTAIPHCSETFMSALNVTPKSFSCVVLPSTVSPFYILRPCFHVLCVYIYTSPKCNNICHLSDHLTNLSRSSCKLCLSVSLVTFLNTFVSSANLSTLLDMSSSKSFIYIKNRIWPNTDTCGTLIKTDFQFEISPSTITLCFLCGKPLFYPEDYIITYAMGF